jgi:putative ABC transport system substrate-binding protein
MRRREFIAGAATWPMVAHAQQAERVRRVGVMISAPEDDQAYQYLIAVFREGLAKLGWVEGRNLQIYLRFGAPSAVRVRASAEELVSLNPDLIITSGTAATAAVQQETQTIAIVFVAVGDPVANGIVKNVARPEGNTTGVTNLFASFGGKWLGLIKEAVPRVERAALVYSPQLVTEIGAGSLLLSIEEAARVLAVKTIGIPFSNTLDIVRGIEIVLRVAASRNDDIGAAEGAIMGAIS